MSKKRIARIKKIISDVLKIDEEMISGELSPNQVDNWDSMHHMKIIISLEGEYGIMFEADEIPKMLNFDKICETIAAKL
jgi:acyl carrier protein